MSEHLTAEEVLQKNQDAMGASLGKVYTKLSDELTWLTWKWHEFIALYGTKKSRLEILNESAPFFFSVVQRVFWDEVLLGLSRLTAPPKSRGKPNLTLCQLPLLIEDEELNTTVVAAVDDLVSKTAFAHDWRNRHIAHRDLSLALGKDIEPLKPATRAAVQECVDDAAGVLNMVSLHFQQSTTAYSIRNPVRGAENMLYVLRDGLRREQARRDMLERGEYKPEMFNDDLEAV